MSTTGPTTEIEIVSAAFVLNGKDPVQSYDEAGKAGLAAKTLYDMTISSILSYPHFRFNVKTTTLQLIANFDPDFDIWRFAYQIPHDYLSLVRLFPAINYQIYEDRIYTSSNSTLQMEYRFQVPVSKWSPAMREYAVYEIAVGLGISIAESSQLFEVLKSQLFEKRAMALFVDSQNHPQRPMQNSSWIGVRGTGPYGYGC